MLPYFLKRKFQKFADYRIFSKIWDLQFSTPFTEWEKIVSNFRAVCHVYIVYAINGHYNWNIECWPLKCGQGSGILALKEIQYACHSVCEL